MPEAGKSEQLEEKEFIEILNHDIRRRIIELVHDRVEMSYSELLEAIRIGDGTLNFHLKKLGDLLRHTPRGTYILSKEGLVAIRVIHTVRHSLQPKGNLRLVQAPGLSSSLALRRIAAFLVDAVIFFVFTGVFFDPVLWDGLQQGASHAGQLTELHPWLFHPEHLPMIGEITFRLVGVYAHIFFAVYIVITAMEAFKGQSPGKYLLGIRVVKVGGGKVELLESAIRNAGKVFLLPLDLAVGLVIYRKRGFIRFFDFYTEVTVERIVHVEPSVMAETPK